MGWRLPLKGVDPKIIRKREIERERYWRDKERINIRTTEYRRSNKDKLNLARRLKYAGKSPCKHCPWHCPAGEVKRVFKEGELSTQTILD